MEVRRKVEAKRAAHQLPSTLQRRLGDWPFAAEWMDWTTDELGRSMAFLVAVQEPPGTDGVARGR